MEQYMVPGRTRKDTKMQKMILPGEWGNDPFPLLPNSSIPQHPKRKVRHGKKRNRLAVISVVALLT